MWINAINVVKTNPAHLELIGKPLAANPVREALRPFADLSVENALLLKALNKIQDWASRSLDLVTCAEGPWDLNVYQEAKAALARIPEAKP